MLSIVVIAKNEEANIRRCLESVRWAEEIIVLDSGSDDKTVEIAKEYTKHVFSTDWQGFGIQKQRALSLATQEWVLNLDADESVDNHLKDEITAAINKDTADAYRVPIQMYFYGKPLKYSSSPSRHIRLFKRKDTQFSSDIVHEKIQLPSTARVGQLHTPIIHQSFRDLNHALAKINLYSSYTAKIRISKGKTTNLIFVGANSFWMFIRCYVLQRGFLDGVNGLIFAILNSMGTFFRGLKQIYPDQILKDLPPVEKSAR
jgi:glycosyltransferase involved in cell wall biosynthesis